MTARPDSIWLVGLSGAGKSTVGPLLADRIGYAFVDLDRLVEEKEGRSVREIFRTGGETAFRNAEAEASNSMLDRTRLVVATGGGWMSRDDIALGPVGCVRVWLRVSPVAACERLRGGDQPRPLLEGGDPEGRLAELLDRREPAYAKAEIVVETTARSPAEVAERIVERIDGLAPWNTRAAPTVDGPAAPDAAVGGGDAAGSRRTGEGGSAARERPTKQPEQGDT